MIMIKEKDSVILEQPTPFSQSKYIDVFNPATGKIYAKSPNSSASDLKLAVVSANKAFNSWREKSNEERSSILFEIANEIEKNKDQFALAETIDNGKPINDSKKIDIPRSINNLKFYASAIINSSSESHSLPNNVINYTLRDPLGVVASIVALAHAYSKARDKHSFRNFRARK